MDSESSHQVAKPERLKILACSVKFSGGNTLLHQFVLQNSYPNDSGRENYVNAVLLSMSDAPAYVVNAYNDRSPLHLAKNGGPNGYSALHLAVLKNNLIMVKKLLSCLVNVDVNKTCRWNRNTAMHLAAELGHSSIIHELLKKGASIEIENSDDETPLCVAARSGHLDTVKFLVSEGSNVNHHRGRFGSPLSYAAALGNLTIVDFLLNSGADVSECDLYALRTAVESRNLNVVKFLFERAVNFDMKSGRGSELLPCAIISRNEVTEKFLVSNGADVHAKNYSDDTPLHGAACRRSLEIVEFLIDHGADLHAEDEWGDPPLHIAAYEGDIDAAKLLIGKGTDLHTTGWRGTPLHYAAHFGKIEFAAFLIDQGADLHYTDRLGWTPLHTAAYEGQVEMISLLLDKGADVDAKNKDGKTPLDLARNQLCMDALQNASRGRNPGITENPEKKNLS